VRALDRATHVIVDRLRLGGLRAEILAAGLNRRRIGLDPGHARPHPPQRHVAELRDPVTEGVGGLGIGGRAEVVAVAVAAAREAGLADPRITSEVAHLDVGLTDRSDSARWAASWLADRGITGRLVLIVGDEFGPVDVRGRGALMQVPELTRAQFASVGVEPGGTPPPVGHLGGRSARLVELLDAQLACRAERRVPRIDPDPAWVVSLPHEPVRERVSEALGALSNGSAGTRASADDGKSRAPALSIQGIYTGGDVPRLLAGPGWTGLEVASIDPGTGRVLDLRTGLLERSGGEGSRLRTLRFVSAATPYALAIRAEASPSELVGTQPLTDPGDGTSFERAGRGETRLARTSDSGHAGIAVAARDRQDIIGGRRVVERVAAWAAGATAPPSWDAALDRLADLEGLGYDRLLADHREAWARWWRDAEVTIEGAPDDQLAARFAVFHLLSAASDQGEAAVGARGLTGPAYGGHVFWDADVFVLPALAAIRPTAARAMLEYRIRRLPAARAAAEAGGHQGARFPWESAGDGSEVTPASVRGAGGRLIPIRTGQHEVHIVADVAWAADHYATWSGDAAFLAGPGRALLVDTARYWASRARRDPAGHAHLYGVMGPDEYHEVVDDNAFTNLMARWNLVRAATLVGEAGGDGAEAAGWRELADELVDGYDPASRLYEQFAGYWDLEPLLIADVARPPVAADVLLGADRVAGSQLIKQADVLMAHHLLADEVVPGSLGPNLAYYEPRTAHGSSLSPAIHACLLARDGQPDRALELFRVAARLDLDDVTGTTAGGLHLATFGGVWQALAFGFLGLRAKPDLLEVDPRLPIGWGALGLRLQFRGQPAGVRAEHDRVTVTCAQPLRVRVGHDRPRICAPPGHTFLVRSEP